MTLMELCNLKKETDQTQKGLPTRDTVNNLAAASYSLSCIYSTSPRMIFSIPVNPFQPLRRSVRISTDPAATLPSFVALCSPDPSSPTGVVRRHNGPTISAARMKSHSS
jgi:hypothetical protein